MSDADQVRIVDDHNQPVEPGLLTTKGPYTFRGYFNAAAHNLAAFTESGFYCSGDIVKQTQPLVANNQRFVSASRAFAIKLLIFRSGDLSQYLAFAFRMGLLDPSQHPQVVQKLKQNHLLHEEAL